MKKIRRVSRQFAADHVGTIAIVASLGTVIVLQNSHIKGLNRFLDEKNLITEYYAASFQ